MTAGKIRQKVMSEQASVDLCTPGNQLEFDPLWRLQPMQLCEERQCEVVVLRRGGAGT